MFILNKIKRIKQLEIMTRLKQSKARVNLIKYIELRKASKTQPHNYVANENKNGLLITNAK